MASLALLPPSDGPYRPWAWVCFYCSVLALGAALLVLSVNGLDGGQGVIRRARAGEGEQEEQNRKNYRRGRRKEAWRGCHDSGNRVEMMKAIWQGVTMMMMMMMRRRQMI